MNDATINLFGDKAANVAMKAAAEYIRTNKLTVDIDAVVESLKTHVKAALGPAMDDAREAYKAGMMSVAEQTFMASMSLAGIEAVKAVA